MKTKQIERAIKVNGHDVAIEALRRVFTEKQFENRREGDEIGARYAESYLSLLKEFEAATLKINGRYKKQTWRVDEYREHFTEVR
jgi:hypothetical protein